MAETVTYSYDPWGNYRNPTTWAISDFTGIYRGYTGHERQSPRRRQMLPQFQLINMNVSFKRGQNEANFNFVER
ncbi:MAG: hypothetical protein LBV69_05880, partial [Bacteroidales bacterium]|nr:hypothetical protein [Bacteroidales bacterium]